MKEQLPNQAIALGDLQSASTGPNHTNATDTNQDVRFNSISTGQRFLQTKAAE